MDAFSEPDLLGRAAGPVSAELRASSLSAGAPGEDPPEVRDWAWGAPPTGGPVVHIPQ
jgi:hypothetical protein